MSEEKNTSQPLAGTTIAFSLLGTQETELAILPWHETEESARTFDLGELNRHAEDEANEATHHNRGEFKDYQLEHMSNLLASYGRILNTYDEYRGAKRFITDREQREAFLNDGSMPLLPEAECKRLRQPDYWTGREVDQLRHCLEIGSSEEFYPTKNGTSGRFTTFIETCTSIARRCLPRQAEWHATVHTTTRDIFS